MPRNVTIVSIFLASPSDLETEREAVSRYVEDWNKISGFQRAINFELLKWETAISAGFGSDGQDVVNSQLPDYDLLIAMLWTRLGTKTSRASSGTAEEYERALARRLGGQQVEIAFYFKDCPIDPRSTDLLQLAQVQEFEKRVQNEGAFSKRFSDEDTLRFDINLLLDRVSRRYFPSGAEAAVGERTQMVSEAAQEVVDEIDEEELGLFDISDNLERHAGKATGILSEMSVKLDMMSNIMSEQTAQIIEISRIRKIEPHEARIHIAAVADGMNDFSNFLELNNTIFADNSVAMANDIRALVDVSHDFTNPEDSEDGQLEDFRNNLEDLLSVMDSSFSGLSEFSSTLAGLQRTTSEANRARRRLVQNCNLVLDTIDAVRKLISQAVVELDDLIGNGRRLTHH